MSTTAGIDIGAEAIKGIVLKAKKNGPIEVVAAGTMPIADFTRLPESEDRTLAIGEKLKELVRSARLRADTRRVGVSGGRTSIRYLQIPPVPPWRLEMLVKYEVEERSEEKEPNCYDYHIMDVPEANGQYTVMVGMCRDSYAFETIGQAKSSGLGEVELDLEALALYSAYYHGHGYDADKTVAIADIGADDLTVLVCKNGALYYARTMIGGGRRFTQNLADDLKLEWGDAEALKKESAEITFEVSPAASSMGRTARLPRSPGGTAILPRLGSRPGASGVLPGASGIQAVPGDAGASQTGMPARSGVLQVPGAASGVAGAVAVSGAGPADESRRARAADPAKMARPGAANPTTAASGKSPAATAPTAPEGQTAPAQSPAQSRGAIRLGGEPDFSITSLDEMDLTPSPAKAAAPAAPVAPAKPGPAKITQPGAPKPAPTAVDEFELQPVDDEPAVAPKAAPKPAPVAPRTPAAAEPETLDVLAIPDLSEGSAPAAPSASSLSDPLDLGGISGVTVAAARMDNSDDKRRRMVSAALVREAATLCAAIENVVLNCKQQAKQPQLKLDRLYITGGASKLKGLPEFMGRRLRVEVQPLEPLRSLSLERLSPPAAAELREEQHTLGVALGLALSDLHKGAFNFVLLPQSVKQRKEFWARGAYHFYAAGAAALAMGVLLYTPYRNTDALSVNMEIADKAIRDAKTANEEIRKLDKDNAEYRQRLKTVSENVQSGEFFLNLMGELKSKLRIQDDVYLTSISTSIPRAVLIEADPDYKPPTEAVKSPGAGRPEPAKAIISNKEPDTFQAQRRVYLRGFVRGKDKQHLTTQIRDFFDKLVPDHANPDNPRNLFKDIQPIWYSKEDIQKEGYFLKEFVLEAYTDAPKSAPKKDEPKNPKTRGPAKPGAAKAATPEANPTPPAPAQVNAQPQPMPAQPAQPQPIQAQPAQPQPVPLQPPPPVLIRPMPQAQPVQPTQLAPQPMPVQPVQPAQPAQPVQPVQPVQPMQPTQPRVQPAAPVHDGMANPGATPTQPPFAQPAPTPQPAQPAAPKRKPMYVEPDDPTDVKAAPKDAPK